MHFEEREALHRIRLLIQSVQQQSEKAMNRSQILKTCFYSLFFTVGTLGCLQNSVSVTGTEDTNDFRYKKLIFDKPQGLDSFGNPFGEIKMISDTINTKVEFIAYQNVIDDLRLNMPKSWKIKLDNYLLFANLQNSLDGYFLILKQNRHEIQMTLKEYFEHVNMTLESDEIERLEYSNPLELKAKDGEVMYSLDGILILDSLKYDIHSYYFEHNENIYDESIKYKQNQGLLVREIYDVVCSSLSLSNHVPFEKYNLKSNELVFGFN